MVVVTRQQKGLPIAAPGQVGGWGRKPDVFIIFSSKEKVKCVCGCFWQLFKVSVEGPLVLGEGMTQPLRVWDLCKVKSRAERPEGGVPRAGLP